MTSLYVDRRGVELELDGEALVFRENGERCGTVPVAPLTRVFLRGDVRLSASLLGKLGEAGVGVIVLSGKQGKPSLLLARPHNDASRRVAQLQKSLDMVFCVKIARDLVTRKLERQIAFLEERRDTDLQVRYDIGLALRTLNSVLGSLDKHDSLAGLRGAEGSAANAHFAALKAILPDSLNFNGRNRRPPRDPFNAVLSLTYTLVHAETAIALFGAGFDPYVGYYHRLDFGRESLASDLMEPIRPVADRFALDLFKRGALNKDDFTTTESGCLLGKAGRARYYEAYEHAKETVRAAVSEEVDWLAERIGFQEEEVTSETNAID
jgi:CRISPR-associated protein Cas1